MITFDVAYTWLNRFADKTSQLSTSALPLKSSIEEALAAQDFTEIPALVEGLNRIARVSPNREEGGEIFVLCAWAYCRMGQPANALPWIDEALARYIANAHNRAVVQWLKGCIKWEIPGSEAQAAALWQSSLNSFSALASRRTVLQPGAQWYQERCRRMKSDILFATQGTAANPRLVQALYGVFEILNPALDEPPEPVTRVRASQFWIGNRLYQLINFSDLDMIGLMDAPELLALKVTDDAMKLAGIEENDYVLLRWDNMPVTNDIVAVWFGGEDALSLRSYSLEGGGITFYSQSDSAYPARSFASLNNGHQVRGVVLGVFKPVW